MCVLLERQQLQFVLLHSIQSLNMVFSQRNDITYFPRFPVFHIARPSLSCSHTYYALYHVHTARCTLWSATPCVCHLMHIQHISGCALQQIQHLSVQKTNKELDICHFSKIYFYLLSLHYTLLQQLEVLVICFYFVIRV